MRQAMCVWLFTSVACASLLACSHDTERSMFESPMYHYSVPLREGWSALPATRVLAPGAQPLTADNVTDILGRDASTRVSQMSPPGVIVAAQPVPPDGSDQDRAWTDTVVGVVASQKHCAQPADRTVITVDGERGELLVYPDCPQGSGLHHLWVAVLHGGRGYHIVWFNKADQAATDKREFLALLADFRFVD